MAMSPETIGPNRFCSAVVAWFSPMAVFPVPPSGGGLVQPDGGIPSSAAVVEAHTNMSRPAHPGLDVNAGFSETDLRAIQIHVSGVDEEVADIWLLGWLLRGRWLLGDEARSHEEQRRREQY